MEALKVEDLWFRYEGGEWVLKGISMKVSMGEDLAIVGANGAGKTTLIKHFNGLLKPMKGRVLVLGKDTRKHSVAELSKIVGIVFQNPLHMFFSNTVWEEIAFSLRNFNFPEEVIEKRVRKTLSILGLEGMEDRSPFTLSGGEMRRLALACVLVYDPDIIIMDEPTVGQDPLQKEILAEIIKMLKLQGKTIIVISHDVDFISENFSRIVVMSKGQILADGKTDEIMYDTKILREANLVEPIIAKIMIEIERRFGRVGGRPLRTFDAIRVIRSLVRPVGGE